MGFYHDQVLYLLRDDKEGSPSLWVPWEPWAPWHPFGGGEIQSREARGGEKCGWSNPGRSPCSASSPVWPPEKVGRILLPRVLLYSGHPYRFHRFFRFVVLEYSPMATFHTTTVFLFRNRPPEELLHQTCRTVRGESDSSTLEVVRRLLGDSC